MFGRWVCVSALAYAGCVAFVCAAGVALLAVAPPGAPLESCFRTGSYAAMALAPLMGWSVLRSVNRTARGPRDEERWWPRANLEGLKGLGVAAGFAAAGAVLGRLVSVEWAAAGLVLGSIWGLLVATLGPSRRPEPW
jgi:hypothetical protein